MMKKLAVLVVIALAGAALYLGSHHEQRDVQIPAKLGKIVQKKVYPNSELTIVYIKQLHAMPNGKELEKALKKQFSRYTINEKECERFRQRAVEASDPKERAMFSKMSGSCYNICKRQADMLALARNNPFDVQVNIFTILQTLKLDGMNVVGLEGLNADGDQQIKKGGEADIKKICITNYPDAKQAKKCTAAFVVNLINRGAGAGEAFEAYNTDEVLTVGLEKSEFHLPLLEDWNTASTTDQSPKLTDEEVAVLWQKREEFAAKIMVEKMRQEGKAFGAIVFGGGHADAIPKYFDEMKISYFVVEPTAYTKQKGAADGQKDEASL